MRLARPILLRWVILAAACGLAYAHGFGVPFFSDDVSSIAANRHIRTLWPLTEPLTAPRDTALAGRPVVSLTFALNHWISGNAVWSYHAGNLLIHILVAGLVAALTVAALRTPRLAKVFRERDLPSLGTAVALLWALHPLNSEAVVYTVQRTELLFSLFLLLVLLASLRAFEASTRGAAHSARRWMALGIPCCALGMACKEVMVVAPVLVLLFDRALVAGTFREAIARRGRYYAGLGACWLVLGAILASRPRTLSAGFGLSITVADYLRTQAEVVLWYLRLALWPAPLAVVHEWPVAAELHLPHGLAVPLLLGLTLWGLWRNSVLGLLGAWFFGILAPTSSFVPIPTEVVAERRMYLPLAALVALVVLGGHRLAARGAPWLRYGLGALLAVAVVAAGVATDARVRQYATAESLWRGVLEVYPESPKAMTELALALRARGDARAAEELLRRSLRLDPDNPPTLSNLASVLLDRDRPEEALPLLERALRLGPPDARIHSNLGAALGMLGREREAAESLRRALEIDPFLADAHLNLGVLLAQQGRLEEAAASVRRAIEIQPDHPLARQYLAAIEGARRPS